MTNEIIYRWDVIPATAQIIELYDSSGINRPTKDVARINKMYANSNLVVTAWHHNDLVGIARCLTDFCYSCYLSDLAVKSKFQHQGIGRTLIEKVKERIGPQTTLLLLSAPAAMNYYPKAGLVKIENGFTIKRRE